MTHDARRPGEVEPRPVVDGGHLSKEVPNPIAVQGGAAQATTLLVAHVEGQDRPRAMVLSPDAVLRLLSQSRGRVVHLTTATDIDEAVDAVRRLRAAHANGGETPADRWSRIVEGYYAAFPAERTAPRTAPLPAGGTAPLPTDVTLTGGTAV